MINAWEDYDSTLIKVFSLLVKTVVLRWALPASHVFVFRRHLEGLDIVRLCKILWSRHEVRLVL